VVSQKNNPIPAINTQVVTTVAVTVSGPAWNTTPGIISLPPMNAYSLMRK
jgi:hypothetical protein